ncbi:hypothetical protein SAMN05216326_11215 [Nitrosomonas marina]|uniref:DUF4405 domain-containing protein n=1 Tax=Nitrosomonas marina TaxID=917 RepID=A0A1I0BVE4_9PROT|nr:hypothetical protein [Nitrosomonas marina]SET10607.1 hypothetical protein SAMN05216326_11215 [Nitrosomonas marina]
MSTRKENERTEMQNSIVRMQIIGVIPTLFLGLGIYGLVVAKGDAFHPLLNNHEVVYTMLATGIVLEIWHLSKMIPLFKQYAKFKQLSGM